MNGSNAKLSNKDKVQCLCCLSTKSPEISNNKVVCASCGSMIQTYINMHLASVDLPMNSPIPTKEA
jgi:hypothetical protein